ncbi:acetolactate synthase-1/2/3 large subunit [Actinokineospora baliensis]|uniref:thiamine pyrophosphate-dependent enzyme n=1 Tax=Actinokineospora baliensis TaxID=547056 RepID=UPI00195CFAE7|nr:thiamine pyrophosphate-dependent enzyme [Actinokineospora baliensis]MBM7774079.1 acetolactate synthase-1/2/3 large subunit [Actinokineospora baliensis]
MVTYRTGGESVVAGLKAHGLTTVFGLPGVQNDWLYNAFYDAGDDFRVIHTRHEQGAGFMALGATMATGLPSVCNVVPGPGVLNAGAALATAYGLNAKLFFLTGQVPQKMIGRELGTLHEVPDQPGLLRSLSKHYDRVTHPAEAGTKVADAVRALNTGRPRPVTLEVPMDVLAMRAPVPGASPVASEADELIDAEGIDNAVSVLAGAANPMIFVANGAQDVSAEVTALAELLQAPVVGYRTGRGIVDSRHPLSCFLPEAKPLWAETDVVIALGGSARSALQGWGRGARTLIRIDADQTVHGRYGQPDVAITGRLESHLPVLLDALRAKGVRGPDRTEQMRQVHAAWRERSAVLDQQIAYLSVIREALGDDGIFVDELTQIGFASRIVMPVHRPRTFLSTGYMGTLGYGFPTALGAKVAKPDTRVLSVTGDGGFLFAATELATAVQHGIGLVTVLFNNSQYGNVQQMQRDLYGGRVIATDLVNPDFEGFVTSFGAGYARAESPAALAPALDAAFANPGPTVIEVPVGDMVSVDRFR